MLLKDKINNYKKAIMESGVGGDYALNVSKTYPHEYILYHEIERSDRT